MYLFQFLLFFVVIVSLNLNLDDTAWRRNSNSTEEVARFQRLIPKASRFGQEGHPTTKILFQHSHG